MALTIYQLEHSPFCIPITASLRALRQPFRAVNIPNSDRSQIIRLTKGAYYQVPLLVDGRRVVYESSPNSQDVARYVDRKFACGRLFPRHLEGQQAIFLSYIENEIETVSFRLVDPKYITSVQDIVERTHTVRHKERKFGRGCIEQWRKQAPQLRQQVQVLLEPFDQMLRHSPFVLGDMPVHTDFALFGIIGNLTYRNYNLLPPRLKALHAWQRRLLIFRFF